MDPFHFQLGGTVEDHNPHILLEDQVVLKLLFHPEYLFNRIIFEL